MIRQFIERSVDRWANFHPVVRFLVLTAVAALLAWVAAKPGYQAFKAWRVDRNLSAARKAVNDVRMDDARDFSLTVLRAGDPSIEAYRILEKATRALRDPSHGEIAWALLAHPQGSDEDRLQGFSGIAHDVAMGLLGQAWTTLSEECQQDPRFAALFADRLLDEQRISEAAMVLLAVPEAKRNGAIEARLVRVLIGSGKGEGYDEAQRIIAAKMLPDGTDLVEWLDLLERIPPLSLRKNLLEPVHNVLANPPDACAARAALMLKRIDYAASFPKCAAVLDEAIANWKDRDPLALANFLGDLGLHENLLETFPMESLETHPDLLPRMLDAVERGGAWTQVVVLLDKQPDRLPKFEDLAHRALVAAKTGDSTARLAAWSAAMADAKACPQPIAYLTLHRIASEARLQDEAEQAMVAAIRLGRGPLPLYENLKPLMTSLARQGRDNTLLEVCASYVAFEPGNPVLLTQFAYLACLANAIETKTLVKAMETLANGFPKELPIHCVLATAYLCDGQITKAAETLDRLDTDPDHLAPGYRAAFLTTQVLNHRIAKDDPRITDFPWKSLLPSERKKFNELIRAAE